MNEVYPLDQAAEAYERMMSGKARFRVVLTTGTRTGEPLYCLTVAERNITACAMNLETAPHFRA